MLVSVEDLRLRGVWRMVAATSGHLDEHPRIEAALLTLETRGRGRLGYVLHLRTPRGERLTRGTIPTRPSLGDVRSWLTLPLWALTSPFHGTIHLGRSGDVAAVVTPGSMLLNPGTILFARDDMDAAAAHRAFTVEREQLELTATQLREMRWRINAPGTDCSYFEEPRSADGAPQPA